MTETRKGKILLSVTGYDPQGWDDLLSTRRTVVRHPGDDPASIDYAVVWKSPPGLLATLPNLKAIFSVGAGVDHILTDPDLPDVPIVRVVADNLSQYMTEYVCWRVLDHHRQGLLYRTMQRGKDWGEPAQPPAGQVTVGVMGFGTLGQAAARALLALGFTVRGWSRSGRGMAGVEAFGADRLDEFLGGTDILVVLLPYTPATDGVIDYALLSKLRRDNDLGGAFLVNAGRGGLQNEADILRALDDGTLKEASLDVFRTEPLPEASPLWTHPKVFVTPHTAASSDAVHLVPPMLDQMDAFERGEPLRNLVDREAGY